MSTTPNLHLTLTGNDATSKSMTFAQWRNLINGEFEGSNMKIIDNAFKDLDGNKTEKHLLSYNGTNITEDGQALTYSNIHDMLMNSPDFVVLVYNDRAYHPNRVSDEQIVFITSYVSNGYLQDERISISDDNVVTLTSGKAEMTANKTNSIDGVAEDKADEKYPSVKAVIDYVRNNSVGSSTGSSGPAVSYLEKGVKYLGEYEYGTLNSDGTLLDSAKRIRTKDYYTPVIDEDLYIEEGYSVLLCRYQDDGQPDASFGRKTYTSANNPFRLEAGKKYKISILSDLTNDASILSQKIYPALSANITNSVVDKIADGYLEISWEQGSLDSNTGEFLSTSGKRIYTKDYIPISKNLIHTDVKARIDVYYYKQNADGGYSYLFRKQIGELAYRVEGDDFISFPASATHYRLLVENETSTNINVGFANNIHIKMANGIDMTKFNKVRGCVSFTDDGGSQQILSFLKPLFGEDHRFTASIVTSWIGGTSGEAEGGSDDRYLTWDDIVALQDEGYDIESHTVSHMNLIKNTDTDGNEVDTTKTEQFMQLYGSKKALNEHGIQCKYICYPNNDFNDTTHDIMDGMYDGGIGGKYKPTEGHMVPLRYTDIGRISLGSYQEVETSVIKEYCRLAKEYGTWVVFCIHSQIPNPKPSDTENKNKIPEEGNQGAITDVFNYCVANDIDIVTFDEGFNRFSQVTV